MPILTPYVTWNPVFDRSIITGSTIHLKNKELGYRFQEEVTVARPIYYKTKISFSISRTAVKKGPMLFSLIKGRTFWNMRF
jgi:hypothetical protein